jgi:hypothetical protein
MASLKAWSILVTSASSAIVMVTTDRPVPWLAQFLEEFNAVQDRRPQISEQAARRNVVVHLD